MTEPRERPTRWSKHWWWTWLGIGLVVELWSLRKGGLSPLTSVLTHGPLKHPWLSGLIAAALSWGLWHLAFDNAGLGTEDVVFVALGAILGFVGHWWRHRRDESGG